METQPAAPPLRAALAPNLQSGQSLSSLRSTNKTVYTRLKLLRSAVQRGGDGTRREGCWFSITFLLALIMLISSPIQGLAAEPPGHLSPMSAAPTAPPGGFPKTACSDVFTLTFYSVGTVAESCVIPEHLYEKLDSNSCKSYPPETTLRYLEATPDIKVELTFSGPFVSGSWAGNNGVPEYSIDRIKIDGNLFVVKRAYKSGKVDGGKISGVLKGGVIYAQTNSDWDSARRLVKIIIRDVSEEGTGIEWRVTQNLKDNIVGYIPSLAVLHLNVDGLDEWDSNKSFKVRSNCPHDQSFKTQDRNKGSGTN